MDYKIKLLDLFKTASWKSKNKINADGMEIFAEEIAKTSLKESIKDIYVTQKLFHPDDIQIAFERHHMEITATGGDTWPFTQAEEGIPVASSSHGRRSNSNSYSPPSPQ